MIKFTMNLTGPVVTYPEVLVARVKDYGIHLGRAMYLISDGDCCPACEAWCHEKVFMLCCDERGQLHWWHRILTDEDLLAQVRYIAAAPGWKTIHWLAPDGDYAEGYGYKPEEGLKDVTLAECDLRDVLEKTLQSAR